MIYLNEWLPNPKGTDTGKEFIELYNSGPAPVALRGWAIVTEGHKKFIFQAGSVPANGYLVFGHATTKLSLKNADGGLALYDSAGRLVDEGIFSGPAPEGQSFSRVDHSTGGAEHFTFVAPTPGALNKTIDTVVTVRMYPVGLSLVPQVTGAEIFFMMLGTGIILAGLILYIIDSYEDLSELLFRGNKEAWGDVRKKSFEEI